MEQNRSQRHKVHADTIFGQLMEAHINSKHEEGDIVVSDRSSSHRLTLENFGASTGLNWPEARVAREIAGLIDGFTQEQQDKLIQMRKIGRAVAETLTSMTEFNGRGNPELFPYKSKQQIAAKLLDMFGYEKLKISSTCQSTVPARAGVTSNSGRGGSSSSPSKVSKLYVYRDGGGKTKLKPAAGIASPPTSSAAVGGFNIVHNILDDVPSGSRYYRDQEPFLSTAKPATANTVRLSRAAARAAPRSRFSKYDAVLAADGGGGGGVGGGGFCGFNKTLRHGSPRGVVDVVSPFSAHAAGAEGGGGGGNGMVGSLHSSSRAGDGYIVVNGAGYPSCPTASSGLEALQTPTHGHHRPMDSPDVKAYNRRQLERSRYTMDEPVWDMRKSAVFTGWLIPRSSAPSRPAMPKSSKVSSALLSPEARGSTNMPHHSPLVVSNRFVNGCSTTADLPPPTARPRDCYLPPSDRFRKKPRTSLTTITGATMDPPPSVDGPTVAIEAPSSNIEGHFSSSSRRTERQHFGTAAEGPTGSFDNGVSMAASAAACSLAAGGSPEKRSQPLRSFPASVSLAELKSLRLAFGSALTKEAWLLGTSNLLDAELDLD